ncbi:conserved hypothetical protein [Chthoniobacter flavus Ellin428]|uniref:Uncharacterized protein n=1 Tax=Chthoniobacter flavus Ellin428 TaxID=497964 RepID=B4D6M5_9BACT|nr:DUF4188 domain-containing protein [Chthoniobacter flavus]EDY17826.1 conserved hypothetical protein [Chthoniobacter flavus Ellin428]
MIITDRMSAQMDGPFCVFLIGMRINRPWKVHRWLPVFFEMPRMLAELKRQPELGMLGGHLWFGRTIILLQYWRSFEALTAYARRPDLQHLPAWGRFRQRVGTSGDVGIWHETYPVSEGQYESIYANMPPFGLGKVGKLILSRGATRRRPKRMGMPAVDGPA